MNIYMCVCVCMCACEQFALFINKEPSKSLRERLLILSESTLLSFSSLNSSEQDSDTPLLNT